MTRDEVEALIKTKTHNNKLRINHLEEREGGSVAFLSYSIDDQNKMTIWHTEVPQPLQHMGIGGKLVEEAVQLASRDSSRLRIVCPFAKEHLARHPELNSMTWSGSANGSLCITRAAEGSDQEELGDSAYFSSCLSSLYFDACLRRVL